MQRPKRSLPSPPGQCLTLVDSEPGVCALGRFRNVAVVVWWAPATVAAVQRVSQLTRHMCVQHPDRISKIHVVKDGTGLPGPEAREAFIALMHDYETRVGNVAVVVHGSGFWSSAMRSAITSMRFVSPRSFEMRLHGDLNEVTEWLPESHQRRTGLAIEADVWQQLLREADALSPQRA